MKKSRFQALIFDMDGTMVDSMPWHSQAWVEYARRHHMQLDVPAFMVQTTGKNAFECACALMGRTVSAEESERITAEKSGVVPSIGGAADRAYQATAGIVSGSAAVLDVRAY